MLVQQFDSCQYIDTNAAGSGFVAFQACVLLPIDIDIATFYSSTYVNIYN